MVDLETLLADHGPLQAGEDERAALRALERLLTARPENGLTASMSEGGRSVRSAQDAVELPETAWRLLRVIARSLARGEAVKVVSFQPMLSAFGIADLLNVSIAHAEQLLDEGELPFVRTETNDRRVRFQDVMTYKVRRDAERREALTELARLSQELGLYDAEFDDDPWAEQPRGSEQAASRPAAGRRSV
jgi:excisionase family DNA binding protein